MQRLHAQPRLIRRYSFLTSPPRDLIPIVAAELDELILFLKRAFQMTIVIVTHEMTSAFRIADRLAMLYKGSLIAVEDKVSFQASTDPRIRQFLDRIPDHIAESESVQRRMREFAGDDRSKE